MTTPLDIAKCILEVSKGKPPHFLMYNPLDSGMIIGNAPSLARAYIELTEELEGLRQANSDIVNRCVAAEAKLLNGN